MQLGMIGLGRMGGNMVRRLMRAGHECAKNRQRQRNVVFVEGSKHRRTKGQAPFDGQIWKVQQPKRQSQGNHGPGQDQAHRQADVNWHEPVHSLIAS